MADYICDDGCNISIYYVNDEYFDCSNCEDEAEYSCSTCSGGCPSSCGGYTFCTKNYFELPERECVDLYDTRSRSECSILSTKVNDGYCDCDGCEDEQFYTCSTCDGGCPSGCDEVVSESCGDGAVDFSLIEADYGIKICGGREESSTSRNCFSISLQNYGNTTTTTQTGATWIPYPETDNNNTRCAVYYIFDEYSANVEIFVWCIDYQGAAGGSYEFNNTLWSIEFGIFNDLQSVTVSLYLHSIDFQSWIFDYDKFITTKRERGATFYQNYIYFYGNPIQHSYENELRLNNLNHWKDQTHFDLTIGLISLVLSFINLICFSFRWFCCFYFILFFFFFLDLVACGVLLCFVCFVIFSPLPFYLFVVFFVMFFVVSIFFCGVFLSVLICLVIYRF